MVVCGGFMILTRGNPLDEYVGYVGVSNGYEIISVDGYKYSYNYGEEENKTENFVTIESADEIPQIDYFPNDKNCKIEISYTEDYTGKPTYAVYNEKFECIIKPQTKLQMPGAAGNKYYIEATVNWGTKDKNLTMKYYFAINITE